MGWIQFQFTTNTEQQELLEDALLEAGASSITYVDGADQPILEPGLHETPLWDSLQLIALFDSSMDKTEILSATEQAYGQVLPEYEVELLQDKDWEREWMDDFKPMRFGDNLWICPSWCEPEDPDAVNVRLDPGLAFGTGTHPTTAMCLDVLDKFAAEIKDKRILDVGTGSGILAIAALLLGAEHVLGTDIDPQALTASRDNAERNGISADKFDLVLAGDEPSDQQYDIVLANILAGPLVELAPMLQRSLKPGGLLVLSGLLIEQQADILDAYEDTGFAGFHEQEPWLCLQGVKLSV